MDLCFILVSMIIHPLHESSLYWYASMMSSHLNMIQSIDVLQKSQVDEDIRSMNSFLEAITCSYKDFTYNIPLASCFGGHSVTPKSHHQHVMRSQTSVFVLNPKL